jgi:hypothetical protein
MGVDGYDVLGGRERRGGVVGVPGLVGRGVVADPAVRGAGGALGAEHVGNGVGLDASQSGGEVVGGEHLDEVRERVRGGVGFGDGRGDGQLVVIVGVETFPCCAVDGVEAVRGEGVPQPYRVGDRGGRCGPGALAGSPQLLSLAIATSPWGPSPRYSYAALCSLWVCRARVQVHSPPLTSWVVLPQVSPVGERSASKACGSSSRSWRWSGRSYVMQVKKSCCCWWVSVGRAAPACAGYVFPFAQRFFAVGGERIDRKRSAWSERHFAQNEGACDRVRNGGHGGQVANYDRQPPRDRKMALSTYRRSWFRSAPASVPALRDGGV